MSNTAEDQLYEVFEVASHDVDIHPDRYSVVPMHDIPLDGDPDRAPTYTRTAISGIFVVPGGGMVPCELYDDNANWFDVDVIDIDDQQKSSLAILGRVPVEQTLPLNIAREFVDPKDLEPENDQHVRLLAALACYQRLDSPDKTTALVYDNKLNCVANKIGLELEQRVSLRQIINNSDALGLISPDDYTRRNLGFALARDFLQQHFS